MNKAKFIGLSLVLSMGLLSACGDNSDNANAEKGEGKLEETYR